MIQLTKFNPPTLEENLRPVGLTDDTMAQRRQKLLDKMTQDNFDCLIIYADLEHGSNFEYLTGFLPRFEEALLVLHKDGKAYLVLGNENLNKADKARLKAEAVHMPHLSLPNQPMNTQETVEEILSKCDLEHTQKIGLVGWKNFTSTKEDNYQLFDLPHFLVHAVQKPY